MEILENPQAVRHSSHLKKNQRLILECCWTGGKGGQKIYKGVTFKSLSPVAALSAMLMYL